MLYILYSTWYLQVHVILVCTEAMSQRLKKGDFSTDKGERSDEKQK